jgi:hypothetical protein
MTMSRRRASETFTGIPQMTHEMAPILVLFRRIKRAICRAAAMTAALTPSSAEEAWVQTLIAAYRVPKRNSGHQGICFSGFRGVRLSLFLLGHGVYPLIERTEPR